LGGGDASGRAFSLTPHAELGQPVLGVPPRPSRSVWRPGVPLGGSGSAGLVASAPYGAEEHERQYMFHTHNRRSSGGHSSTSTARPRRRSTSLSSPPHTAQSMLTFRELGSGTERHALTEQEKADKWADLLERSARAGGTLHLGGVDLPSDQLRFSKV